MKLHRSLFSLLLPVISAATTAHAQLPDDCDAIGTFSTNHTCAHGTNGPYADLTAVATALVGTPVPQKHVYTTVTLPGADGVYQGELQWRYPSGGYHALWTLGDYPIVIRNLNTGELVPQELGHAVAACAESISTVRAWNLVGGTRYRLQIGPVDQPTVKLVAENLEEIASPWYPDADGDGYGVGDEAWLTYCTVPEGWAEFQNGDCDDEDPSIRPDQLGLAETLCDGVDQDCDEVVDDGFELGESCTVGEGVCEATGTTICSSDHATTTCSAEPLASCGDAGVEPTDAGTTPSDGGVEPMDAGDGTDGGRDPDPTTPVDASMPTSPAESNAGCGCRVGSTQEASGPRATAWLLATLGLTLARRRRRAAREH